MAKRVANIYEDKYSIWLHPSIKKADEAACIDRIKRIELEYEDGQFDPAAVGGDSTYWININQLTGSLHKCRLAADRSAGPSRIACIRKEIEW